MGDMETYSTTNSEQSEHKAIVFSMKMWKWKITQCTFQTCTEVICITINMCTLEYSVSVSPVILSHFTI